MSQTPTLRKFKRSHKEARNHFLNLSKRYNYDIHENRKELFKSAKEIDDPTDPLIALAFYNQFGQDFKMYPINPFTHLTETWQTMLISMIYLMRLDIDYRRPRIIPIFEREVMKLQTIITMRNIYNRVHLKAMANQTATTKDQKCFKPTTCNLYDPSNFQIPTLQNIILTFIHLNLGMTEITHLHRVKKDVGAQLFVINELKEKKHLPNHLIKKLKNLHLTCRYHSMRINFTNGTKINEYSYVLKPNSELHFALIKAKCPESLMNRILTREETGLLFVRYMRSAQYSTNEIDEMLHTGFRILHNYDMEYPGHMLPTLV